MSLFPSFVHTLIQPLYCARKIVLLGCQEKRPQEIQNGASAVRNWWHNPHVICIVDKGGKGGRVSYFPNVPQDQDPFIPFTRAKVTIFAFNWTYDTPWYFT